MKNTVAMAFVYQTNGFRLPMQKEIFCTKINLIVNSAFIVNFLKLEQSIKVASNIFEKEIMCL